MKKPKQSIIKYKTRCPRCAKAGHDNSGDNLVVYEDGGQHCFSSGCGYTILSEDLREPELRTYEHEDKLEYSSVNFNELKKYTKDTANGFRGISDETYRYYGVRHRYNEDELVEQIYPLTNNTNELCGIKIRGINPKKFFVKGSNKGETTELFGQAVHRKSKSNTLLLLSGELDCLAAHEMLSSSGNLGTMLPAMVSSTIGEDGSKQFKAQYEFFNKFEKIIVIPDTDKPGKEALEKLVLELPRNKVYVVDLPRKDTNEMLMEGLVTDFIIRYKNAKPYVPEGIIGSASIKAAVKESARVLKIPLPPFLHKVEDMLAGGFSLESIVNIAAASGIGLVKLADVKLI